MNEAVGVPFKWRARHLLHGHTNTEGEGKTFFHSPSTIQGEFHDFFGHGACFFRGDAMQNVHTTGSTYNPPAGTLILDQMRVEWSETATAVSDAPAEEVTVKEETPAGDPPELVETTSGVVATELWQDRTILSGTYSITSERLDCHYKYIPHDLFQLTFCFFFEEKTDIWWGKLTWMKFEAFLKIDPGPSYDSGDNLWS